MPALVGNLKEFNQAQLSSRLDSANVERIQGGWYTLCVRAIPRKSELVKEGEDTHLFHLVCTSLSVEMDDEDW